jgi:hypothetical protein
MVSTIKPIGSKNTHIKMNDFASVVERVESIVKGSAIVPFKVVFENTKLILDDVEVTSIWPIVP